MTTAALCLGFSLSSDNLLETSKYEQNLQDAEEMTGVGDVNLRTNWI